MSLNAAIRSIEEALSSQLSALGYTARLTCRLGRSRSSKPKTSADGRSNDRHMTADVQPTTADRRRSPIHITPRVTMAVPRRPAWPVLILCRVKSCTTSRGPIPPACPSGPDGQEPAAPRATNPLSGQLHRISLTQRLLKHGSPTRPRQASPRPWPSTPPSFATAAISDTPPRARIFPSAATGMPFASPLWARPPTRSRSATSANSPTRPRRLER
jgi:hypothetical protein